ncbi:mechanosensitive ion channel family protein [Flaviaesturariibacter flavus]|nr:mechanosensitive ion channel domain-containing protein [Flaviaesturariibacter flavus]
MNELLTDWLRGYHLSNWGWNAAITGSALVAGLLLSGVLWLLARLQQKDIQGLFLFNSLVRHLAAPVNVFVPFFMLNLLRPDMRLSAAAHRNTAHFLEIALILTFSWMLIRFIRVFQDFAHRRININQANNLRQRRLLTQLLYVRRVIGSIIVLLTIGAVLLTFSSMRKLGTGLLTGVGVGGIIIGFAAQRSLANLLAGFQIAFTQPIRIDDEVVVEGEFGRIEEITLTYVVVRIWDERRLVLPITYFLEKPFQNWTRTTANTMGTVFLYVDFSVPVEAVRAEFLRFVAAHPLWDKRVGNLIVSDAKRDVLELRALVSGSSSGNVFDLRCAVREHLLNYIKEHYPGALPQQRWTPTVAGQPVPGEGQANPGGHEPSTGNERV